VGAGWRSLLILFFGPTVGWILITLIFILDDGTPNMCESPPCSCENQTTGMFSQPANVFSSFAFTIVSIICALHAAWVFGRSPHRRMQQDILYPVLLTTLPAIIAPASMAYHLWFTYVMGVLDLFSVMTYASMIFMMTFTRRIQEGKLVYVVTLLLWSVLNILVILFAPSLVTYIFFIAYIVLTIILELIPESPRTQPTTWIFFGLAVLFIALSGLFWILSRDEGSPLCDPESWFQGHALWHVLAAIAMLCIYGHYQTEPTTYT
jgi:hypothetical protein